MQTLQLPIGVLDMCLKPTDKVHKLAAAKCCFAFNFHNELSMMTTATPTFLHLLVLLHYNFQPLFSQNTFLQ